MNPIMTDKTWIDEFIFELRMRRVPGAKIGDAVASVRELIADTGQSAEEAFGAAREYAASLDLPVMSRRRESLKTVFLPVLGLFVFLIFTTAGAAWFAGNLLLLSVPQALLLAVPVLLTAMFAFPFSSRAMFQMRWLPVALVLVAGATAVGSSAIAPTAERNAWLVLPPLPILIAALSVLVLLSVIGTIATLRRGDTDEIVTPLETQRVAGRQRKSLTLLLVTDWLFPALALVVFAMNWGFSLMRP